MQLAPLSTILPTMPRWVPMASMATTAPSRLSCSSMAVIPLLFTPTKAGAGKSKRSGDGQNDRDDRYRRSRPLSQSRRSFQTTILNIFSRRGNPTAIGGISLESDDLPGDSPEPIPPKPIKAFQSAESHFGL
jgi:hypothetical protein